VTSQRLKIEAGPPGHVALVGVINEDAQLLALLDHDSDGRLVVDLARVRFINSLGVRDWIRLVAHALRRKILLELVQVSEPLVQQFNMIVATRAGVAVRSFYAPFACDPCDREDSICIEVAPNLSALQQLQPPAVVCPVCGGPMAFNDFPERYFAFLSK
jgi:anti-anti-sigma regulatory factor